MTHENSNISITGEVLQCLRPRAWLNDEVNFAFLSASMNLVKRLLIELAQAFDKGFSLCK